MLSAPRHLPVTCLFQDRCRQKAFVVLLLLLLRRTVWARSRAIDATATGGHVMSASSRYVSCAYKQTTIWRTGKQKNISNTTYCSSKRIIMAWYLTRSLHFILSDICVLNNWRHVNPSPRVFIMCHSVSICWNHKISQKSVQMWFIKHERPKSNHVPTSAWC